MTLLEGTAPAVERAPGLRPARELSWQRNVATWLVFATICVAALLGGMKVRRWTWEVTKPIRFSDIYNGFKWGDDAAKNGYLNLYERMKDQVPNEGEWLDYAPLRLLVMRQWGLWARANYPDILQYDDQLRPEMRRNGPEQMWKAEPYEFTAPVLRFNTLMELFNAVGVFFLVRLWVIRSEQPAAPWRSWQLVRRYVPQGVVKYVMVGVGALMGAYIGACMGKGVGEGLWSGHKGLGAFGGWVAGFFFGAALVGALGGLMWKGLKGHGLFEPPLAMPVIEPHAPFRGFGRGLFAALLVWFNPAMILSAHGWPTWDMWIIPFYVYAMLFASLDWWFCAGVMIAIGAMFKGQQLFVAPVFILWPILLGRVGSALRWIAGLVFGLGVLASPWMVSYPPDGNLLVPRVMDGPALKWVLTVTAAVVVVGGMRVWLWWYWRRPGIGVAVWRERVGVLRGNWRVWLAIGGVALAVLVGPVLILWPWFWGGAGAMPGRMIGLAAVLPLLAVCLPLRRLPQVAGAALGGALLLCMVYFHGSHAWADCGWLFGTHHWVGFVMGMTSNLPGLLNLRFGWYDMNEVVMTIPQGWFHLAIWSWPGVDFPLTVKPFFFTIFVITLLITTVGIAFQARRNDPRFLIAITTPWILFFCIPCQIHERYLLYAAGIGMVAAGESIGMALMAVFLSIVTWIMTIHVMLNNGRPRMFMREEFGRTFGMKLHNFIRATHPDIAWAILLCAVIYFYMSLTPSRSRVPRLAYSKK